MTPPAFDTRNWTLRIGDSEPIELTDRVSDLGFTRGDHGPGELHATLPLDWSPLLPADAAIARKAPVALWDGPVRMWAGKLCPVVPDVAAQTIALMAQGDLEELQANGNYGLIETTCDYTVWLTDLVSKTVTNTKYQTDTNNRLRITLPAQSTVGAGAAEELFFMLPTWLAAYIQAFGFDWTFTNADAGPWEADVYFRTAPGVTAGQDVAWTRSSAGTGTSVVVNASGTDKRCVTLKLRETSASGKTDTSAKREITLVNICVYVRSTTKQRVDEAIAHVLTDTGVATTVEAEAIGDPLDTIAKLDRTTAADVCQSIAETHTAPVFWNCEAGVGTIRERPSSPPSRDRQFVAFVAPAGPDQCSCEDYGVVTDSDQGTYDYVALSYLCKGDAVYPDGVEMVTVWPTSPAPGATDRVLPPTYPQEVNITAAVAAAYAEQLYMLVQQTAPAGDIPLDDTFICNVDGVAYPVWQLHEGDWCKVPDDPACPAEGWYVTGVTVEGSGATTLHVGGAETALAAAMPSNHQKVVKPGRKRFKTRSWKHVRRRKRR